MTSTNINERDAANKTHLRFSLNYLKSLSLLRINRRFFLKIVKLSISLLLQPLAVVAHLLGFRRLVLNTPHIGHLASEPDCFLKLKKMGLIPDRRYFIATSTQFVANECLLNYWKEHIPVINSRILSALLSAASSFGLLELNPLDYVTHEDTARYYEVMSRWANRPSLLSLSNSHKEKGKEVLRRLGMPDGAWYVCLNVREGGFAPRAEKVHSYRNADVSNHRLAIETIASLGGWTVRVGDSSTKEVTDLPNFIDYAHSSEKSDWMDIFLCADCKLFVGDTSGLFFVSTVFGVPAALVNMIPHAAQAFGPKDIFIHKLLREKKSGAYLKFSDILNSPLANFREASLYLKAGVEVEENSPEDIKSLVEEAILRIRNEWKPLKNDEIRQTNFKKLYRPGHYGYNSQSSVGSSFLAKYEDLI